MCHLRLAALAAAVAVVIGTLGVARPVAADALYPGDGGGVWGFSDACDDAAWSRTYQIWYILNDAMDYVFDIPDPDFTPGTSVEIDLEPTVVGTLNGSVTLTGADTISDAIPASNPHPGDTMWQERLGAVFTLTFTPGTPTTGELPIPDDVGAEFGPEYTGFAAVHATITVDGGAQQTIVMLAQGFKACETVPNTAMATHAGGVAMAAFIALATSLLMLGLVNGRALRRRR